MGRRTAVVTGLVAVAVLAGGSAVPASAGRPVRDPQQQTLRDLAQRHHLAVGTAIDVAALDDPAYRQVASTQFSSVTAENVMKWETLEPVRGQYDWGPAEEFMAFAEANDQKVRGHVLVWNNQLPSWLTEGVADGSIDTAELREILHRHITTVVQHFRGRIWQWDVVNEAVTDSWDSTGGAIGYKGFWYQHLGAGYVADAFRWARAADPKALLFYNDYNIDAFGDRGPLDKTAFVHRMVKDLRARHVPIDGVGSQAHLSTRYGNYSRLPDQGDARQLRAARGGDGADRGRRPEPADPENPTGDTLNPLLQAQAYNYSALMQGCLASRHCLSYTVWGFDDAHSWTNTWDFGSGVGTEAMAAILDEELPAQARLPRPAGRPRVQRATAGAPPHPAAADPLTASPAP